MAKALFGAVGIGADVRIQAEVRRLRCRVHELEAEVARLRSANADLVTTVAVERDLMALTSREPALT
ncbi:MAG: hypothetical protein ABJC62_12620 [Frankiaceae bacterium]|jgi:hypothetical protein